MNTATSTNGNGMPKELPVPLEECKLVHEGRVKSVLSVPDVDTPMNILEFNSDATLPYYGKLPFELEGSGAAKAMMAAYIFELMARSESWQELKESDVWKNIKDEEFRNRLLGSSMLDIFSREGAPTHYKGMISSDGKISGIDDIDKPSNFILVEGLDIQKPIQRKAEWGPKGGVIFYDYKRAGPVRYIIPIKTVFRVRREEGSSFEERLSVPYYLNVLGLKGIPERGGYLDRPILEHMTMHEPVNRYLSHPEAFHYSGLTINQVNDRDQYALLQAMWLTHIFNKNGLSLVDGKIEFGLDRQEYLLFIEGITIDNIRIKHKGLRLNQKAVNDWYEKHDSRLMEEVKQARQESQETKEDVRDIIKRKDIPISPPDEQLKARMEAMYYAVNAAIGVPLYSKDMYSLDDVVKDLALLNSRG